MGGIGDKGKRKTTLIVGTSFYGIIQIIFSFASTVPSILFLRFLAGIAAGGLHVGLMAELVDLSSNENRKVIIARYSAIFSLCSAIGFLIGGLLGYFKPRTVFIIQGFCIIIISILIKLFLKETNAGSAYLLFFNDSIVPFFMYSFLFFTLYTVMLPILQGFTVEGKIENIGFMAGLYNAMKYLGEMIGAIIAGFSYGFSSKMPFLISAISLSIAFLLSLFHYIGNKRI